MTGSNEEKLKQAFVSAFGINKKTDFDSLEYRGIPQWTSIGHLQLVTEIEKEFDVMLETDDVINLSSYRKAKEILAKHGIQFAN